MTSIVMQFARFGTVGVANTLVASGLIVLLTWWGLSPYAANIVGYIVGTAFSFVANSRWTFGASLQGKRLIRFLLVISGSYLVNVAVLEMGLRAGWGDLVSQFPAMVCFTLVNFFGQRHYTFRQEEPAQ